MSNKFLGRATLRLGTYWFNTGYIKYINKNDKKITIATASSSNEYDFEEYEIDHTSPDYDYMNCILEHH